jgi:hypothetical protein
MNPLRQHFAMVMLTAALVPILEALSGLNSAALGDVRSWALGLLVGVIRSTAVAALAWWQSLPRELPQQ